MESFLVKVEVDIATGMPGFNIVGLPDITVREAKERIKAAITNSGLKFPARRMTVNLSPAGRRKEGSHFDLPIAVGILKSSGQLKMNVRDKGFLGELSLDGRVNEVKGVLPLVMGLKNAGLGKIYLPKGNLEEARLVQDVELFPLENLRDIVEDEEICSVVGLPESWKQDGGSDEAESDFSQVAGQENLKRAALIACSGYHGLFILGPPGSGKTMVASRIPGIMPPMTYGECLEVTKIYSIGGKLKGEAPLLRRRPFRAPHHSASEAALAGGGAPPLPGEISLAHRGVLFLDEMPEFARHKIDLLRQPLEEGRITVCRASGVYEFPSDFMLVAAANPCPCGYYGDPGHSCSCSQASINRYQSKISGPIMDRIDIHVEAFPPTYENIVMEAEGQAKTTSADMRRIVTRTLKIQEERFKGSSTMFNSRMSPEEIKKHCSLDSKGERLMKRAYETMGLSGRGYHKILKVARTIADIRQEDRISEEDLAEAIGYRSKF